MFAEPLESTPCVGQETDQAAAARSPGRTAHPLGPLVGTRAMVHPALGRLTALVLLIGCGAVLSVSALLRPDARGYGTHEQLAAGPCGFPLYVGLPCPSCGMSTAFAHTVRGHWLRAAYAQPMGWLLCLATIATIPVCVWSLWRGRVIELNWYRINAARVVVAVLFLFLGAWVFKIVSGLLDGTWQNS